jgi:hypothetical protein
MIDRRFVNMSGLYNFRKILTLRDVTIRGRRYRMSKAKCLASGHLTTAARLYVDNNNYFVVIEGLLIPPLKSNPDGTFNTSMRLLPITKAQAIWIQKLLLSASLKED